jgi:hypothetical protein
MILLAASVAYLLVGAAVLADIDARSDRAMTAWAHAAPSRFLGSSILFWWPVPAWTWWRSWWQSGDPLPKARYGD